jgi:Zn-dependent protease with chaperone function
LVLALALLAGTYLAVFVMAVIGLAFIGWPWLLYLSHPGFSLVSVSSMFASVTASSILALGSGLSVIRQVGEPWRSIPLPADGSEPLRAMIDAVAAQAHTAAPPDLRLTAIPNAGVTERPRLLGLRSGERTLYLGLPLLAGLTEGQLRAVLSHEMGHYAGGHAGPGRLVHRGLVSLAGLRAAMRMIVSSQPQRKPRVLRPLAVLLWGVLIGYGSIGYGIFTWYESVFHRVSFAMRRGQEYHADRIAEQIVGGAELASALRRTRQLAAAWHDFETRFLSPMRRAGCLPDDPFEAFGRMLADDTYQEVLREFELAAAERPTSATDTHPALADRLAQLEAVDTTVAAAGDIRSAVTLIPALPGRPWAAELAKTMQPRRPQLELLSWEDCLKNVGQARAAALAGSLLSVVSDPGASSGPTLADVLRHVELRRDELATALADRSGDPAAHPVGQLTGRLFALIAFTLVARGHARWQVSWRADIAPGSYLLTSWDVTDTATEQIAARVNSFVVDPGVAGNEAWLLDHLRSLGVDPGKPIDLAAELAASRAGANAAAARTVVISPAAELVEISQSRTTTRVVAVAISVVVMGIGAGLAASHHSSAPSFTPVPQFTMPSYGASLPQLTFPKPLTLPTALYRTLPSILLQPKLPLPGFIRDCPPPLGAHQLCTIIVVRSGDTLSQLACRYQVSVQTLQQLNGLGQSTALIAGHTLIVPFSVLKTVGCG